MEPKISSLVEKSFLQRDDESSHASATAFAGLESSSASLQPDYVVQGPNNTDSSQDKITKSSSSSQQSSEARRHETTTIKSIVPLKEVLNHEETLRDSTSSSHVTTDHNLTSSQGKDNADETLITKGLITLPEPKSARKGTRRPWIPPLLQGLHQPPPDAGLFPPITANSIIPARNAASERPPAAEKSEHFVAASNKEKKGQKAHTVSSSDRCKGVRQRRKWSNEETNHLIRGVARHGIGRWKEILLDPEFVFSERRAVDLKDRFRTCYPDEYRNAEQNNKQYQNSNPAGKDCNESRSASGPAKGMYKRFPHSQRRARRIFTKEDDAALVKGHAKYGALWHKIRDDPDLNLGTRQATDLRDRLRNVHPELFGKSDFKGNPRESTLPTVKSSANSARYVVDKNSSMNEVPSSVSDDPIPSLSQASQFEDSQPKTSTLPSTLTLPDLFSVGDEGYLFEGSTSPVILSRTILDWGENNSNQQSVTDVPSAKSAPILEMSQGIDPSMTVHSWDTNSNNVSSSSARFPTSYLSPVPSTAATAAAAVDATTPVTTANKSEALNLPPLSQTLMPFDMTVGGLLWEEYDHLP